MKEARISNPKRLGFGSTSGRLETIVAKPKI